mmetsp:Transcript_8180/g.12560  ORF Transcript_8180/g.12560 Transcript_8180/m.12560 type:complete len:204 (+) Transcript_8180:162-773(+)|eukprot:CAMPEP_0178922434 /NCGR_PEP_ID=MMETSP0786-20121207/16152_1 /TAXON_ID=186022 /ORGANISM="Thalassionema frauenfeldii, Strain CCMP 1798" /LENGTH=203 /DNA_ID=CAMNT_0020596799 /DNA_START=111 /DNA_END=722 /DNA_ORIENTATION=+
MNDRLFTILLMSLLILQMRHARAFCPIRNRDTLDSKMFHQPMLVSKHIRANLDHSSIWWCGMPQRSRSTTSSQLFESSKILGDEDDRISPTHMEHSVDETYDDRGNCEQHYNYLDYHFTIEDDKDHEPTFSSIDSLGKTSNNHGRCSYRVRTYLDEINKASVFGGLPEEPVLPDLMAYLQRRFRVIQRLGNGGYEVIWRSEAQ